MSNLKLKAVPADHAEALEFLAGRVDRVLGYATRIVNYGDGSRIHVLHHGNVIATYYRDAGRVQNSTEVPVVALRTAGWDSMTTTNRMSLILKAAAHKYGTYGHVGIGLRHGQAELRTWDDAISTRSAMTIGNGAVAVYVTGYITIKVDAEGKRMTISAEDYAASMPY